MVGIGNYIHYRDLKNTHGHNVSAHYSQFANLSNKRAKWQTGYSIWAGRHLSY
jgi:hypothetical protein